MNLASPFIKFQKGSEVVSTGLVPIINFRHSHTHEVYPNYGRVRKSQEDDEYILFPREDISSFLGERTGSNIRLEDLMKGGAHNITPFIRDDSNIPVLYGMFMLGQGCMASDEVHRYIIQGGIFHKGILLSNMELV